MQQTTIEDVGEHAMFWQMTVQASRMARYEYLDKLREVAGEERMGMDDPRWPVVKAATDVEYATWRRAKADERNALRRLERAVRRCES